MHLSLSTRFRHMGSRGITPFLNSELAGGLWLNLRPLRLTPEKNYGTHWMAH
jgi:hypothetical protein